MQPAVILAIGALAALVVAACLLLFHFTSRPRRAPRPRTSSRPTFTDPGPAPPRAPADELIDPELHVAPVTLPSPHVLEGSATYDLGVSYTDLPPLAPDSQPSAPARTSSTLALPLDLRRPPTVTEVGARPLLLDLPPISAHVPPPASDPDPTFVMSRPPVFARDAGVNT